MSKKITEKEWNKMLPDLISNGINPVVNGKPVLDNEPPIKLITVQDPVDNTSDDPLGIVADEINRLHDNLLKISVELAKK